jgi:hypothetical protein
MGEGAVSRGTSGWVVEGHEPAASPRKGQRHVSLEGERVRGEGGEAGERDGPEGDDERGLGSLERGGEVWGAGADLAGGGPAVAAARIEREAEDGVGDGHVGAVEARSREELFETFAGHVAGEGGARAGGAEATRGLADEEDRDGARGKVDDGGAGHDSRAGATGAGAGGEVGARVARGW